MTIADCQITDKGSIANHFNNYCGQNGTSMANSIPLVILCLYLKKLVLIKLKISSLD